MADAFEKMDRMYHLQRHFYDFTRKYYLLGRDQLLREMDVQPGDTVLEIGCGTGRNLVILAKRHPEAHFFGLDASADMLEMADAKIDSARLRNITLANVLADEFYYVNTFEMTDRFDKIFFSYSISMIPDWPAAIDNALSNLKPGGELFIVDFYDQKDLPRTFRKMLQNWLKAFHVQFWNDLLPYLGTLETKGLVRLQVTPIYKRYAFNAKLEKV
jgi:S-adenosylmethionine-diacylgycerolhomoserine-N-methlytransferase